MKTAGDGESAAPEMRADHALERFGWIASRLLDAPMAVIVLAEPGRRPRIAASWGLSAEAGSAAARLCAAIGTEADGVIPVARSESPLRSAAVAPLLGAGRQRLGTLCVFDRRSRDFTATQLGLLVDVAGLAAEHLILRTDAITAREQLAAVNAASPSAIIFATREGTVTGWNAAASSLLGWTQEELVGKEYALAPPELAAEMEWHRRLNLDAGETFSGFQTQRLTSEGRLLHVSISAAPVRDAAGAISGTVVVMDDLTEQRRLDEVQQRRSKCSNSSLTTRRLRKSSSTSSRRSSSASPAPSAQSYAVRATRSNTLLRDRRCRRCGSRRSCTRESAPMRARAEAPPTSAKRSSSTTSPPTRAGRRRDRWRSSSIYARAGRHRFATPREWCTAPWPCTRIGRGGRRTISCASCTKPPISRRSRSKVSGRAIGLKNLRCTIP
jgi:PAS domain S-box-containing protein